MGSFDERHYETLTRIDTELRFISEKVQENQSLNCKEHETIMGILDRIKYDLDNCPHSKIQHTEKQIEALWSWIKVIIVAGGSTLTGIVVSIVSVLIGRKL